MCGYYKDREPSEVEPLAKELYEKLDWFFSEENVKVNIEPYNEWAIRIGEKGLRHNKYAYINAYVDWGDDGHMWVDEPTCDRRGCSFFGTVNRYSWNGMSEVAKMKLCTEKAKEILHIKG